MAFSRFAITAFVATVTCVVSQEIEGVANATVAQSPIQKVVTLLEDMKSTCEKEGEEDTMAYNKYACWCTTTEKQKEEAIESATTEIEELTTFVAEAAAKEGELKTDIEGLADDIQEDKDALQTATAIREKEKSAFEAEEADMSETIVALGKAVDVLKEVQLLQKSGHATSASTEQAKTALVQVQNVVKRFPKFADLMQKDLFDVLGSFDSKGFMPKRAAFQQQDPQPVDPSGMTGAAAGAKSYNSRSGGIFGVLTEMLDEFKRDLKEATEAEAKALAAFEKLKEAKEGEIAAAEKQMKSKKAELAALIQKMTVAKRDMEKLEVAKAADEEFLANLKEGCAKQAQNYEDRTKVRTEEIIALGEALKILTEDNSRDLFEKTVAFVQVSSVSASQERLMDRASESAMKRIAAVAKKHGNWALASLAVRTRLAGGLDGFTKVKEAMDKMTAELKAEQVREDEKKAYCAKEIDATEDQLKVNKQEEADLDAKHQDLSNTLATLADDLAKLASEVSDNEVALKQAGENRKAENGVFQQSISDQRAMMNVLRKAEERLKMFYTPNAELAQIHAHNQYDPMEGVAPPPPKPQDYEKSAGAGGVLQVFAMIITDAETVEIDIEKAEQQSQSEYATFTADTTAAIEADRSLIAEKEKQSAQAEGEKSETEEAQLVNGEAIAKTVELLAAHHTDCDWLLKYFEVRKTARAEELDSISDAKAILSGADFGKEA